MKKIAVVGLYSIPNMGDLILCETTQYLIGELLPDAQIIPVDVCPRFKSDYNGIDYIKYRISRKMKTIAENKFSYDDSSKQRYEYEYHMWSIRLNRYYKKMFKDVDAIIFAGGGFLKFKTQGLNYYVEQIVKIASDRNIPIMMNGVGIEGYDENDIRCQNLKKVINFDVVKIITTRDDICVLENNYITNPNTVTARVGDPALWTPECYGVSKNLNSAVIGINIIRGKVFKDYGNSLTYSDLKDFYKALLIEANKRNLNWKLFSNGMKSDQSFGREILKELDLSIPEHLMQAPKTSEDLLDMVKSYKCIFGMRLHACITAYSIDIPVVGVIWNEKTRFFSQAIGKSQNFFEESEMDVNNILDKIESEIVSSYDIDIRNKLKNDTKFYLNKFIKFLIS